MLQFDLIQSGLMILLLIVIGEFISKKLKGMVPSVLVASLLYLFLKWFGILPDTLVQNSALSTLTTVAMMFIVIGMGISTNLHDLIKNWKVVLLSTITYIGQTALLLLVITILFDRNVAVGALPGGAAVAYMIQEKAKSLGLEHIIVQSVLIVAVQAMIACPFASWMVRKEALRMKKLPKQKKGSTVADTQETNRKVHSDYSAYRALFHFYLVAWVASRLATLTGLSAYVYCLILGVVLGHLGILPRDEMKRSSSQGLLTLIMMTMLINGFSTATPQLLLELMFPLVCIFATDLIGIFLFSTFFGRFLDFSRPMSFALGLNGMIGFPLNLMLSQDIIEYAADSEEEKEELNQQITSKLIIAGFTSVTFLSTLGAAFLINFMHN